MAKQLLVLSGPDAGQTFVLSETATVLLGRSRETPTRLSDPHVSRNHCQVEVRGQQVLVTDLQSAAGTFVNGKQVSKAPLRPGDVIRIGETELQLVDEELADQVTLVPVEPAPMLRVPPAPRPPPAPTAAPPTSTKTALPPAAPSTSRPPVLPADQLDQLSGTTLSHFEIGSLVARGQTGMVFQARDTKDNREMAFKVFFPEFSKSDDEVQRFIRAMKTMLPLRHPNLVALYGAGKTGPYCWISMEYVKGQSLTQVIERIGVAGMLDWRHTVRAGAHVARALDFAHGHQIVHRNIRPSNILIQGSNKVAKLGDLMLAKALEGSQARDITKPGEMLGDIRFLSPEQTTGSLNIDARSDIYSLGATLYALLTGQAPFDGMSLLDTIVKINQSEPVRPKKFQLAIPDMFESVVLKMLAKKAEDRYQTAAELQGELERVAKLQGVKL